MAIKYTHLKDSSPFTADALNARVADATDGINEIKQADIGRGAFRTEHLPVMIGVPGVADPADQLFSVNHHMKFIPHVYRRPFNASFEIAGAALNYTDTTGRPELVQGGDTTALVILFNLQVRRFLTNESVPTFINETTVPDVVLRGAHRNFEDLVSATFHIRIRLLNPNTSTEHGIDLPHTSRTISPGLTQIEIACNADASEGIEYEVRGLAYKWDDLSHKNVAIRTVLTGKYLFDQLGYATDASGTPVVGTYYQIVRIFVVGQCRFCRDNFISTAIEYTKSNLTAIPVKALVSTNE